MKVFLNKKGYVSASALITMVLVMAFAVGIFWLSSYNYSNSLSRHKEKQIYQYSKGFMEISDTRIDSGDLNENITDIIKQVNKKLETNTSQQEFLGKYAKEYSFVAEIDENNSGESQYIDNPYNNDLISVEMNITYFPDSPGAKLNQVSADPASEIGPEENFIKTGDVLEIDFMIRLVDSDKRPIAYNVLSTYTCTRDDSLNDDGSAKLDVDGNVIPKTHKSMKWTKESSMGKFIYSK